MTRPAIAYVGERGAALLVVMVTLVALLSLGGLTILSSQSELSSSAHSKFYETALFAAESGANAGMEYFRTNCNMTTQYSDWVNPNNTSPQLPTGITGNNVASGGAGNPFQSATGAWYQVYVLNNTGDPGLATGDDTDGTITLRVYGYGPNQTQVKLEATVQSPSCTPLPSWSYAQEGVTAYNNSLAYSPERLDSTGARTISMGGE